MAKISVISGSVSYDGNLYYVGVTNKTVTDSYDNYQKSLLDIASGMITVTEAFTATSNTTELNMDENIATIATKATDILADTATIDTNVGVTKTYLLNGSKAVTADSTANATLTMTVSGVEGQNIYLWGWSGHISGGAAASTSITITVKDGSTAKVKETIGVGSPIGESRSKTYAKPLKISTGANLVLEITAGGTGVITTGNLRYEVR